MQRTIGMLLTLTAIQRVYYIVIQRARVRLYSQNTSARCITAMYHSPNRWKDLTLQLHFFYKVES